MGMLLRRHYTSVEPRSEEVIQKKEEVSRAALTPSAVSQKSKDKKKQRGE